MQRARPPEIIAAGDVVTSRGTPAEARERLPASHPVAPQFAAGPSSKDVDRAFRSGLARLTAGLAPSALAVAFFDWAVHLAASPGKQFELAGRAMTAAVENAAFASHCARGGARDPCRCALPQDNRFRARSGNAFHSTSMPIRSFPSNDGGRRRRPAFAASAGNTKTPSRSRRGSCSTWPRLRTSLDQSGGAWANLLDRAERISCAASQICAEDLRRPGAGQRPAGTEAFQVGKRSPSRPEGRAPHAACGNHPIRASDGSGAAGADRDRSGLDHEVLHPRSVAGELAGAVPDGQGFTVFMISWKNPGARIATSGSTTIARKASCPRSRRRPRSPAPQRVHAVGYCLGGTLLGHRGRCHGPRP